MARSLSCATCLDPITARSQSGLCRRCNFRAVNKASIGKGRQRAFGMRLANRFVRTLAEKGMPS